MTWWIVGGCLVVFAGGVTWVCLAQEPLSDEKKEMKAAAVNAIAQPPKKNRTHPVVQAIPKGMSLGNDFTF